MYTNKQIWSVSYPILLSLLAQNVINVTDTAFLGHVSEVALGASAMGGLFYICVFTIAFGFSTGSQIVIARRNGEGRYSDVGPVMIQGIMFLFVMALLLFGFTKAFGGNIMRLLVSSESIYEGTMEFLNWRIYGFFFSFINVMFRALYIGITRTKVLTINAIVMALTNVVLDYALIFGKFGLPEMGIIGAAIASVLAEASSILFFVMLGLVALSALFPQFLLSIYTSEAALITESVPSVYVICCAMLIASVANVVFNGISGTGNTQAALLLETITIIIYGSYIIFIGMWLKAPIEICFTIEIVYYSLLLITSYIYLKKAKWQNKKI